MLINEGFSIKIPILGGNEMCLPSSLSLMYTFPDVGSISPLIALISIVLPEPFLPLSPIRKVGLDPDDKRTFKKYSLGMKQRLGIAAAIMERPDIVILDEPINALDEAGAGLIKGLLDELKANGSLIIIACHDTEELNYLSDEIYEIYDGEITGHIEHPDEKVS